MEKKIEEHGLSILSLLIILFFMIGDCYFRSRQIGSMYVPLFLIIPVLCMIFEHVSEGIMSKEQWNVWFIGVFVIGVLVAATEFFLRNSIFIGVKLGIVLTLTILTAVCLSQIKLFKEDKQVKTVERLGKTIECALFLCCLVAPWRYEGLLLNAYLCFISVYAGYIYMNFRKCNMI